MCVLLRFFLYFGEGRREGGLVGDSQGLGVLSGFIPWFRVAGSGHVGL